MKLKIAAFCVLVCGAALAEETPPAVVAGFGATRVEVRSEVMRKNAWQKSVVTVDQDGEISGDKGVVGEKASTDAIDYVASNACQIAQAATASMNQSLQYLYSHTNQMATASVMFAVAIAPETVRSNLTGFVVKTETTGNQDRQWVWYNEALLLRPNRWVTYSNYAQSQSVKCNWVNWTTNGVSVTYKGRTWEGCHECTIDRPSFAQGKPCLDLPNEEWGGPNGIEWGDLTLMRNGVEYYTGFVTNNVTGDVLYFDNGAMKPLQNQ